jgi:hypothetical protein
MEINEEMTSLVVKKEPFQVQESYQGEGQKSIRVVENA